MKKEKAAVSYDSYIKSMIVGILAAAAFYCIEKKTKHDNLMKLGASNWKA